MKHKAVSHMAHVLQIAQRRSDLVKGVLLLLCLFLNLLTVFICRCSYSVRAEQTRLGTCRAKSNISASEKASDKV